MTDSVKAWVSAAPIQAENPKGEALQAWNTSHLSVSVLSLTASVELAPGGRLMLLDATLPDSTQTIRSYSSSPKSGICRDLAIHGFQTTVEAEPNKR